jgi:hypothetical protein
MPAFCRRTLTLAFALILLASVPAAAQFEQLATRVPSTANAITLLNGERLMSSPIAIREGWKDKYDAAFAAGLHSIPPDTKLLVLGADINYEFMQPSWRVGVAETLKPRSMPSLARMAHGSVETIGDRQALALKDNSYLSPGRQSLRGRRIRRSPAGSATDARHSVVASQGRSGPNGQPSSPSTWKTRSPPTIMEGHSSAGRKNIDGLLPCLASVRGVAIELRARRSVAGGDSLQRKRRQLTPSRCSGDGRHGRIEDVEAWDVKVEPNRITLQGPLSKDGLKKFFALIEQPTSALLATDEKPPATTQQPNPVAYASQQYFQSINAILDDARKESSKAKTFGQSAMWFDGYARRIDKLSVLSVDPDLVSFGTAVAASFRDAASPAASASPRRAHRDLSAD